MRPRGLQAGGRAECDRASPRRGMARNPSVAIPRQPCRRTLGAASPDGACSLSVYGERDCPCSPARICRESPRQSAERDFLARSLLFTQKLPCKSSRTGRTALLRINELGTLDSL